MTLNIKEKKALTDYKNNLRKNYPTLIERMMLFGSKARGDYHKYSDIDILLITNKKANRNKWKKMIEMATDPMLEYEVEISPRILPEKEFNERTPFLENVKKDAIELWNQKRKKNLLN